MTENVFCAKEQRKGGERERNKPLEICNGIEKKRNKKVCNVGGSYKKS
jgi:hypothetical protein